MRIYQYIVYLDVLFCIENRRFVLKINEIHKCYFLILVL